MRVYGISPSGERHEHDSQIDESEVLARQRRERRQALRVAMLREKNLAEQNRSVR